MSTDVSGTQQEIVVDPQRRRAYEVPDKATGDTVHLHYQINLDRSSRRALFAGMAMQGLLSASNNLPHETLVTQAVNLAKLLVVELDKK